MSGEPVLILMRLELWRRLALVKAAETILKLVVVSLVQMGLMDLPAESGSLLSSRALGLLGGIAEVLSGGISFMLGSSLSSLIVFTDLMSGSRVFTVGVGRTVDGMLYRAGIIRNGLKPSCLPLSSVSSGKSGRIGHLR